MRAVLGLQLHVVLGHCVKFQYRTVATYTVGNVDLAGIISTVVLVAHSYYPHSCDDDEVRRGKV